MANTTTWYVASGGVTIPNRVAAIGDVHLILEDGCSLTITGGIQVQDDDTDIANGSANVLTIYGQSGDTGKLTATGSRDSAGIGGGRDGDGGIIIINSGAVTAKGGSHYSSGAGIGGGTGNGGGSITINGGSIHATGGSGSYGAGAGIGGGGQSAPSGKITITSGYICANAGSNGAAGIGGGGHDGKGTTENIAITGGMVIATGGGGGKAIGRGKNINTPAPSAYSQNAVVIDGSSKRGEAYGDAVLTEDCTLPGDYILTIKKGSTLTIDERTSFTNSGTIINNGTLAIEGALTNNGTVDSAGMINGSGSFSGSTISQDAPSVGEGYTINYSDETIIPKAGYEVSSSNSGMESIAAPIPGSMLYVRKAENNFCKASEWASFTVDGRPAAPTGLQGESTSFAGESDGKITGLVSNKNYQISNDGGTSWTDATLTGTEITSLAAGNYQVRVKAVENRTFASASAVVTVGSGAQRTNTVTVNSGTGGGTYAEGTTVTIAATVPSGQRFTGWTVNEGGVTLADASSVTTTFIMPAQAVIITANFQNNSGGGSSSGNSGGSYTPPTTYPPTVEWPSEGGGTAAVSPSNPKPGDTVTVKPRPDDGYEVDKITVTDKDGKPVEVTVKPDGTYTFKQPKGKVTIEVSYKAVQPIEAPWNNPFSDVSESDWYYDAVRFVHERDLMNGYSDGRFGPNAPLSRAQLAQILFNKEGRPGVNYLLDFSDVAGEAWYTEAVRWAASQGIVGGYGNSTFGPNDPITREQLAVMLWRYSGSPAAANDELHFNDEAEISGYALEAMRWAVENGILNGDGDGRLGPKVQATRAQVAQMLKNFIENQEETT